MIEYPLSKNFIIKVHTDMGFVVLKYEQANMKESFRLSTKNEQQLNEWLTEFIETNIKYQYYLPRKWYEPKFLYYRRCLVYESIMLTKIDIKEVIEKIMSTRFQKYSSLFENTPKIIKRDDNGSIIKDRPSIFQNTIQAVCKEYIIQGPEELFEKYTMEQFQWMLDGLIFQGNEYSDEGKEVNDMVIGGIQEESGESEELKKKLEKIKEFSKLYEASGNIKIKQ